MRWRIQLFGKVSARRGESIEDRFATKKNAELLGYLSVNPGAQFTRKHLGDLLWPDAEDIDAVRVRLRQAISSLRRQLEPPGVEGGSVLVTERDLVWLNPEQVESDASSFEITLTLINGCPREKVKQHLNSLVDLHQGEFMSGIVAEWVATEQERFHRKFVQAADALMDISFEEGDWQGAVSALKRALAIEKYDEPRYCKLMTAYRYLGRLSEAKATYDDLEARLRRDLGVHPAAETSRMADSIQAEIDSGTPARITVPSHASHEKPRQSPRRFPAPKTRFYGREKDLSALMEMVDDPDTRLITIEGPGGVGKTRLALEMAERLYSLRSGSVWFVPMADLTNGNEIGAALLSAIEVEARRGDTPADLAVGRLADVPDPVLIFDNFEHLIEDGAAFAAELLDRLPDLCCLVTSRQPLELHGEHEYRLGVLDVPPKEAASPSEILAYSSVQLLLDRAKSAKTDFQITAGNSEAIAELCRRLEGIPLAIETCAALIQTTTPTQMIADLSKRFELLVSRRRDIPPRHRSLRAAVECSYRMLPADLAFIFRELAVFKGGWTLESAQLVLGTPNMRDALNELQKRSLVTCNEVLVSGRPAMRFGMLETFRDFAWEMLSSADQENVSHAHEAHFREFAGKQRALYFNNEANADEVEIEQGNLYSAAKWCLADNRLADAMELCFNLYQLWAVKGRYEEGISWLQDLLAQSEADAVPQQIRCACARALMHLERTAWGPVRGARALDLYASLAEASGNRSDVVHALSCRAAYYSALGETDKAIGLCQQALAEARNLGESQAGSTLSSMVDIFYEGRRYGDVIRIAPEAHELACKTGFQLNVSEILYEWAASLVALGRYEESRFKLEEALIAAERVGSPHRTLLVHLGLAACFCLEGRLDEALGVAAANSGSWAAHAGHEEARACIQLSAFLAWKRGDVERAILLDLAANEAITGPRLPNPLFDNLVIDAGACRAAVGNKLAALLREVRSMTPRNALRIAEKALKENLEASFHAPFHADSLS